MGGAKGLTQQRRPKGVIRKWLIESIPTSVQKSYFMLTDAERDVLNIGLQKYRPSQSEPIFVGGQKRAETGVATDERLSIADRGDQGFESGNELHSLAGVRAS